MMKPAPVATTIVTSTVSTHLRLMLLNGLLIPFFKSNSASAFR